MRNLWNTSDVLPNEKPDKTTLFKVKVQHMHRYSIGNAMCCQYNPWSFSYFQEINFETFPMSDFDSS